MAPTCRQIATNKNEVNFITFPIFLEFPLNVKQIGVTPEALNFITFGLAGFFVKVIFESAYMVTQLQGVNTLGTGRGEMLPVFFLGYACLKALVGMERELRV